MFAVGERRPVNFKQRPDDGNAEPQSVGFRSESNVADRIQRFVTDFRAVVFNGEDGVIRVGRDGNVDMCFVGLRRRCLRSVFDEIRHDEFDFRRIHIYFGRWGGKVERKHRTGFGGLSVTRDGATGNVGQGFGVAFKRLRLCVSPDVVHDVGRRHVRADDFFQGEKKGVAAHGVAAREALFQTPCVIADDGQGLL